MRQVVLDTETTGLTVDDGHRIIEIGCLEVVNRRVTGNTLHFYLNPERAIDEGAQAVHGLSWDMLRDKPRFNEVARDILSFVGQAEVIIHNAPFDVGFLDAELARVGERPFREHCRVLDTLALARELHPGKRNSLDALCDRYGISNAHRKLHGALLDAELLADVYLAMTRGQESLEIALHARPDPGQSQEGQRPWPPAGLLVVPAGEAENAAHQALLAAIAKEARSPALWDRLESDR
ncbi:MAG: DNA polymerase III subunit epsilon [Burkholderiaceae bacterium]|nr:DNA polymerase III subunit epsilon [Burkholderiaceae bacterium]